MRNDPFIVLGVSRNATREELSEAYYAKREIYSNDLFKEGEAGADAAKKLQELDLAYNDAIESLGNAELGQGEVIDYSNVRQALTDKRFDDAQKYLDNITKRDAEWHYLQSIVFYNKGWLLECKKQLELSTELEPQNEKYTKALGNLNAKIAKTQNENVNGETVSHTYSNGKSGYNAGTGRTYRRRSDEDACCNVCSGLICADCCCECLGGDLISCC